MPEDRGELGRALEQRVAEVRSGPREVRRAMSTCDSCGKYLKDCLCATLLQEETDRERGSLGRHVAAKSAEVDAWPESRKPAYVREVQEETGTRDLDAAAIRRAWRDAGGPAFEPDYHPEVAIHAELLRRFAASLPLGDGERGARHALGRIQAHAHDFKGMSKSMLRLTMQTVYDEATEALAPAPPSGDGGRLRAKLAEQAAESPTYRTMAAYVRDLAASYPALHVVADVVRAIERGAAPPSGETGGRDKLLARIAALAGNQRVRAEGHATHRNPMGTLAEIERLATAAPPSGETGAVARPEKPEPFGVLYESPDNPCGYYLYGDELVEDLLEDLLDGLEDGDYRLTTEWVRLRWATEAELADDERVEEGMDPTVRVERAEPFDEGAHPYVMLTPKPDDGRPWQWQVYHEKFDCWVVRLGDRLITEEMALEHVGLFGGGGRARKRKWGPWEYVPAIRSNDNRYGRHFSDDVERIRKLPPGDRRAVDNRRRAPRSEVPGA